MRAYALPAFVVAVIGCSDPNTRVAALEAKTDALQKRLEGQSETIERLTADVSRLQMTAVAVSTSGDDFSVARTPLGPFTVSVEKAEPYLTGYRITLLIGNMTSAQINQAKLTVNWVPDEGKPDPSAPIPGSVAVSEKVVTLNEPLYSGAWNRLQLVLSPASAQGIGTIWIRIEPEHIGLRKL